MKYIKYIVYQYCDLYKIFLFKCQFKYHKRGNVTNKGMSQQILIKQKMKCYKRWMSTTMQCDKTNLEILNVTKDVMP